MGNQNKDMAKTDDKNLPLKVLNLEEYGKFFERFKTEYEPSTVLELGRIEAETKIPKDGKRKISFESKLSKALTVFEFENGYLMTTSIPEQYKTLSIQMSRQLQKDYDCKTVAEKALVEVVVINYCRILEVQRQLSDRVGRNEISEIVLKVIDGFGRELDRASRHFLSSLQTLKMMKQSSMTLNINTGTAVVGQNQVVQTKNE